MVHDRIRTRDPWHASPSCNDHVYADFELSPIYRIFQFLRHVDTDSMYFEKGNYQKIMIIQVATRTLSQISI